MNLFDQKQKLTKSQLEQLEQNDRRKNLEIYGVPQPTNECIIQIVKNIARYLDIDLEGSMISTSHHLPMPFSHKHDSNWMEPNCTSIGIRSNSPIHYPTPKKICR